MTFSNGGRAASSDPRMKNHPLGSPPSPRKFDANSFFLKLTIQSKCDLETSQYGCLQVGSIGQAGDHLVK